MNGFLKLLSLFILPGIVATFTFYYFRSQKGDVLTIAETGEKIFSFPYQNTLYEDFGMIYTPNINLSVRAKSGFRPINFLVDTGAIVSALPAKEAESLGVNLAFLPRVAVAGYGGQTTFTYRGNLTVKILDDLVTLPCVFSEVDSGNYILGRKGIFENYTLRFNSQRKAVEFIRKKQ